MNQVILIGRLVKDPEIKYSASQVAYGNYTLATDRPKRKDAESVTDFIYCKVLGKQAEFAERYLKKGTKIAVTGSVQVDNYTDKDGNRRSQTYVMVLNHEFCESKGNAAHPSVSGDQAPLPNSQNTDSYGWMNIPDDVADSNLPFS